jgi:acetyl-CoA carboxylase carboxyl transferase subunit beta
MPLSWRMAGSAVHPVAIGAFNFEFMGGSMGIAVGDGLVAAARLAVSEQATLIVIPASGGARMQEGILSLMQMPRTIIAVDEVREAGLPYIVLLTDPTTGGVSRLLCHARRHRHRLNPVR